MMFSTYFAAAKDILIIAALVFYGWWAYHSGGQKHDVDDMKAVQNQLIANSKQVDDWKAEEVAAEVRRDQEIQSVNAAISRNSAPLWMCRPPNTRPVSSPAAPTQNGNAHTQSGSVNAGPRADPQPLDIRPQITALEQKYEAALADCRKVIASWPH